MRCAEGCEPSTDPRYQRVCVKCSRPVLAPPLDPTRDLEYERAFLRDAVELCQRLTGIHNPIYPILVERRLDVGRKRYGDGDYMRKDNLREVREETPDIASYALLELHKQRQLGLGEETQRELRLDLVAAAAYGAAADWYAQRATRRLEGTE